MLAPAALAVGSTVKASLVAAPGVMLKPELVAPVTPVAEALKVYPVPTLSIDKPEKVATPDTGVWPAPPVRAPPPALFPIASETAFAKPVATLSLASSAVTVTAGAMAAWDAALVGSCEKTRCVAAPGVMLKAALVAGVGPVFEAVRVYPVPALLMLMPGKLATPLIAGTVVVPEITPPPALFAMVSVMLPVKEVATLPWASSAATVMSGLIAAPATVLVGC